MESSAAATIATSTISSSDQGSSAGQAASKSNPTEMDSTSTATTTTFVDYRRPPPAQIQPPSKYKLWLLVLVLVYFAVWVSEAANVSQALRFNGWLSPDGAQFLELSIVVFVLTYGALDWVVFIGTITIGGHTYGLGPWLKCGSRIQWVHQTQLSDYFVVEVLKGAIRILEEGFGMFNATASLSSGGGVKPRKSPSRSDTVSTYDDDDTSHDEEPPYRCTSTDCQTVVKIEHRIDPQKMNEYHAWQKRIERAAQHASGLISLKRMEIVPENVDPDQCPKSTVETDVELGSDDMDSPNDNSESKAKPKSLQQQSTTASLSSRKLKTNLHTVYMTFDNIDSLNDWMLSPRRRALMKQLEPLLAVPDQELIQAERAASARDAFTNLLIQQGQSSPSMPPKKWKVWWLTTLALVITVRWVSSFLAYYLEFWGLDQSHPRLRTLVTLFITTFLNSYVMVPFLLFLFNPWMLRRSNEVDERFIWKTLDDGISSMWLKFLLTFAYYGGCVIAWIVAQVR